MHSVLPPDRLKKTKEAEREREREALSTKIVPPYLSFRPISPFWSYSRLTGNRKCRRQPRSISSFIRRDSPTDKYRYKSPGRAVKRPLITPIRFAIIHLRPSIRNAAHLSVNRGPGREIDARKRDYDEIASQESSTSSLAITRPEIMPINASGGILMTNYVTIPSPSPPRIRVVDRSVVDVGVKTTWIKGGGGGGGG